jgi:hypothetical protein
MELRDSRKVSSNDGSEQPNQSMNDFGVLDMEF